jgi:hypothetical protein
VSIGPVSIEVQRPLILDDDDELRRSRLAAGSGDS